MFRTLAFGGIDALWYVIAGLCLALGTALALAIRKVTRWLLGRARKGYLDWHAEAVDEHLQPKLDEIRTDISDQTDQLRTEAAATAATLRLETEAHYEDIRSQLEAHTAEEGLLVRRVVKEELVPVIQRLDHIEELR